MVFGIVCKNYDKTVQCNTDTILHRKDFLKFLLRTFYNPYIFSKYKKQNR